MTRNLVVAAASLAVALALFAVFCWTAGQWWRADLRADAAESDLHRVRTMCVGDVRGGATCPDGTFDVTVATTSTTAGK